MGRPCNTYLYAQGVKCVERKDLYKCNVDHKEDIQAKGPSSTTYIQLVLAYYLLVVR